MRLAPPLGCLRQFLRPAIRIHIRRPYINPFVFTRISCRRSRIAIGRRAHRAGSLSWVAKTAEGELLAVAPCYLKSHSRGEYVFRPRLGPRPMSAPAAAITRSCNCRAVHGRRRVRGCCSAPVPFSDAVGRALAGGLIELCKRSGVSRRACDLCDRAGIPPARASLATAAHRSAIPRRMRDLRVFDEFLAALAARKRKTIRRGADMDGAWQNGITVHWLTGAI